jgi:imidazolonepropionase-like amidohydrolase
MKRPFHLVLCTAGAAVLLALSARANAPYVYAITGARIVTAAGAPVAKGTLVIRNGLIESVGATTDVPADAVPIAAAGLTVYPGLIDMGTGTGLAIDASPRAPESFATTEESERWKRSVIFRPDQLAANHLKADDRELAKLASIGVTSVLATPPGVLVKGQSALVNVVGPGDEPQIGAVADPRRGVQVVRTPVALHVELARNPQGDAYPASLLGSIAFVRQSFLDAQHQQLTAQRYERAKTGTSRPVYDPALDALQPALGGRVPVAFEANEAREIMRALAMAAEFKLDPVITGAREADRVAGDLKARNARVIYSLRFPTRPKTLAPDADEPARTLRLRANAPRVPAALERAGVVFAFSSAGLREARDFVRHAARAVKEGLSAEAAVRALTIDAARIAGAAERLGSIEQGKIANVIVTEGDLFDEKMRIRHVFVDGRLVPVEEPGPQDRRGRSDQ